MLIALSGRDKNCLAIALSQRHWMIEDACDFYTLKFHLQSKKEEPIVKKLTDLELSINKHSLKTIAGILRTLLMNTGYTMKYQNKDDKCFALGSLNHLSTFKFLL